MFKAQTIFKTDTRPLSLALATFLIAACTNSPSVKPSDTEVELTKQPPTLYPLMSAKQCADVGGELVGDIGDGRIHQPDYLCNNGTAPVGTISTQDEPVMTEGAVCCGP